MKRASPKISFLDARFGFEFEVLVRKHVSQGHRLRANDLMAFADKIGWSYDSDGTVMAMEYAKMWTKHPAFDRVEVQSPTKALLDFTELRSDIMTFNTIQPEIFKLKQLDPQFIHNITTSGHVHFSHPKIMDRKASRANRENTLAKMVYAWWYFEAFFVLLVDKSRFTDDNPNKTVSNDMYDVMVEDMFKNVYEAEFEESIRPLKEEYDAAVSHRRQKLASVHSVHQRYMKAVSTLRQQYFDKIHTEHRSETKAQYMEAFMPQKPVTKVQATFYPSSMEIQWNPGTLKYDERPHMLKNYTLNITNFDSHTIKRTLEVRLRHGSNDYTEIVYWIKLMGLFFTAAYNNAYASAYFDESVRTLLFDFNYDIMMAESYGSLRKLIIAQTTRAADVFHYLSKFIRDGNIAHAEVDDVLAFWDNRWKKNFTAPMHRRTTLQVYGGRTAAASSFKISR